MLSCFNVANYFLLINNSKNLTNLKMQKLVYYAYGWYLARYDERLFKENMEAWNEGAIIPELHHALKHHQDKLILTSEESHTTLDESTQQFLRNVFFQYNKYSLSQLNYLTNIDCTPWSAVFNNDTRSNIINDHLIRIYFLELQNLLDNSKVKLDEFSAAKILAKDSELCETMYVFSDTAHAEELYEVITHSSLENTVEFDWENIL